MIAKAVSNLMTFPKPRLRGHKTGFLIVQRPLGKMFSSRFYTCVWTFGSRLWSHIRKDPFAYTRLEVAKTYDIEERALEMLSIHKEPGSLEN